MKNGQNGQNGINGKNGINEKKFMVILLRNFLILVLVLNLKINISTNFFNLID